MLVTFQSISRHSLEWYLPPLMLENYSHQKYNQHTEPYADPLVIGSRYLIIDRDSKPT